MSFQDRHDLGEVLLSLNYLPCAGRLTIDVIKAKQLLQTDLYGGSGTFLHCTEQRNMGGVVFQC